MPDPNHFNSMQARLERDLINTQDHFENLWLLVEDWPGLHIEGIRTERDELTELLTTLRTQREQVAEFLKYMRMVAGMTLEFPNRTERREYLRANGL